MSDLLNDLHVDDGDPVAAAHMAGALTAAALVFDDGASQTFTPDGRTTYTEGGRASSGEWRVVGDGRFESFWPPSYTATYDLTWVVKEGAVTGLTFVDRQRGDRFEGRYR
jgi:hypothetical protein